MTLKLLLLMMLFSFDAYSHGGVDHSKKNTVDEIKGLPKLGPRTNINYLEINKRYITSVKPIFKNSCFDCHSSKTNYPWYYKVPGIKQLIDLDIKEAKSHLDFSYDFPFESHETPLKDLKSIGKAIATESMPPREYRWLHPDSVLSKEEKNTVKEWVEFSLLKLDFVIP